MRLHVLFVLPGAFLILLEVNVLNGYTVVDYTGIVALVFKYYHSKCIILLYSPTNVYIDGSFQSMWVLLQLQKFLSGLEGGFQVLSVRIQSYNHEISEFQCRNKTPPLGVVLTSDATTQRELMRLSQSRTMSQPAWLLFLNGNTSLEYFFYDINIPFDCKFLVAQPQENRIFLTEVYRIAEGMSLMTHSYGSWESNNGTIWATTKLYERRNNLHGVGMKGVSLHNPPVTILRKSKDGIVTVDGFFGSVWSMLESRLNFSTSFRRATAYGTLVNGSWNGMIKMLRTQEVDVALSEFTMTKERLGAVEFTFPLIFTRYYVFIQQLSHDVLSWDDFLQPFSTGLWLTVCASVLVLAFLLSTLHNLGRRCGNAEADGPSRYSLYDSLHCVFGIFCQQGHDFTPNSGSCRLVYLTAYLIAVILLSAYSAALVSFLTKKSVAMPFKDLQGLLKDGSYKLGVMENSAEYRLFENSVNVHMHEVFKKLIQNEPNLPSSAEEGVRRICLGKYAFMTTVYAVSWQHAACRVMALPSESFPASLTFALIKNSPYKGIIDYNLHDLRDKGVLKRLRVQWWKPQLPKLKSPWYTVDFYSITPILVVLAAGVIMAGILLVLERKWHHQHKLQH
ncbi:probable glutamate receptor [Zootermopsis nevadensis]|uniref:probable glutamate receptor n=1 Tax=Zootermopsis nevadensis TaxID=136037 RepID=UPI000B8E5B5E|nr:probable glutamate receptor [Zootermopsis nevadensis]